MKNKILLILLPLLLCCTPAKQPAAATLAAPTEVVAQMISTTEALLSWKDNAEGLNRADTVAQLQAKAYIDSLGYGVA